MTEEQRKFIAELKCTDFYAEYVDKLFVSEEDETTVYYTAKKQHPAALRGGVLSRMDGEIMLVEMHELESCDDAYSRRAFATLKEI